MKMVRTGGVTVLVATMLAVAGCGGGDGDSESSGSSGPAELRLWLNGTDTPQELRDYLVETFAEQNGGASLVIDEHDWNGLVPRLQAGLATEYQTRARVGVGS